MVTVFQTIDDDENGVTATCHDELEPMSVQVKLTDVGVTAIVVTSVIVLGQLVKQSKLKQVLLFTAFKIAVAG